MIAVIFVLLLLLGAFTVLVSARPANVQSWWLVDSGGHMDWGGSTRYQAEFNFAVTVWNAHRPNVIRQVRWNTMTDVMLRDFTDRSANAPIAQVWRRSVFVYGALNAGRLEFNIPMMDSISQNARRMTTLHELGHVLGVDHIPGNNVMQPNLPAVPITVLTTADRAAANRAWNYHR